MIVSLRGFAYVLAAAVLAVLTVVSAAGATHGAGTDLQALHVNAANTGGSITTLQGPLTNAPLLFVRNNTVGGDFADGSQGDTMHPFGAGVVGVNEATSGGGTGVWGQADSTSTTDTPSGVYGLHSAFSGAGIGVLGETLSNNPNAAGVRGSMFTSGGGGVGGWFTHAGTGWGTYGFSHFGTGVVGETRTGFAGYFFGNVNVTGTLTKSAGSFKIDHPLDPANKYLQHSFVESPDMKNVYDGVVTTDARGFATVRLPTYFQALNTDFRYQLTTIGEASWGARVGVWREIAHNRFVVRSDRPRVKVSWQVTGTRDDAYARAYRIRPETPKPAGEQGRYVSPEQYGQPLTRSVFDAQQNAQARQRARYGTPRLQAGAGTHGQAR